MILLSIAGRLRLDSEYIRYDELHKLKTSVYMFTYDNDYTYKCGNLVQSIINLNENYNEKENKKQ